MGTRSFERAIVQCVIHTFLKFIARSKGTYIILYLLLALLIRLLFSKNCDFAVSHKTQVWPVPTKTKLTSGSKHYPYKFIILTVLNFQISLSLGNFIALITLIIIWRSTLLRNAWVKRLPTIH